MTLLFCFALFGCVGETDRPANINSDKAQSIVDSAMMAMGGEMLENAQVSFRFRERDYIYHNENGRYAYTRIYKDTTGEVTTDLLTNEGFIRTVDGDTIALDSTWTSRYSNSVNSVIYFAFLPYRLNDHAVIKTYNGVVSIKNKDYHEVMIQFQEEGGGVDHDDSFLYWFDMESYALDFLAYDYVTNGGGVRFREAVNRRVIDGLTIQDYINYKPRADSFGLRDMRRVFETGGLTELSRIELKAVEVQKI